MKVLVINLLRLGDFIQIQPVLQGLRAQLPIKQLDVFVHKSTLHVSPLVQGVNRWWTLDRDELQHGLGKGEIPLLTAFDVLREQLDEINAEQYDCVINLTQTYFSAWITGYLKARKLGLSYDSRGQAYFHSPWFQYLEEHAAIETSDVFHHTDIFNFGCGLEPAERAWNFRETERGRAEVNALGLEKRERIVLQLLTSDAKKNWATPAWVNMMRRLQASRPDAEFVLLGAPNEKGALDQVLETALKLGVRAKSAILSLEGAFSLLERSQLLITGDTSIKHLANASKISILELSLGSSDYRRTGAYKPDSLILQPTVNCAPCPHSSPCRKAEHECAKLLSPALVAKAADRLLAGDWRSLSEIAKAHSKAAALLRTHMLDSGFWMAIDVAGQTAEATIDRMLTRCAWKFVLDREFKNPLARFGSEGHRLRTQVENIFGGAFPGLLPRLDFLEGEANALAGETFAHMQEKPDGRGQRVVEIGEWRRAANRLERVHEHAQVKAKLIRSLKSQLTESI